MNLLILESLFKQKNIEEIEKELESCFSKAEELISYLYNDKLDNSSFCKQVLSEMSGVTSYLYIALGSSENLLNQEELINYNKKRKELQALNNKVVESAINKIVSHSTIQYDVLTNKIKSYLKACESACGRIQSILSYIKEIELKGL